MSIDLRHYMFSVGLGLALLTGVLYVHDVYFSDRWEWPTAMHVITGLLYSPAFWLPAILLGFLILHRPLWLYTHVSLVALSTGVCMCWQWPFASILAAMGYPSGGWMVKTTYWLTSCSVAVVLRVVERQIARSAHDASSCVQR